MDRIEKALDLFENGSNCAQAVLCSFADRVGLSPELAHRLGTGLGAGLGRKQLVCGAINAGAILISLKYGNESNIDAETKEDTMLKVRAFLDRIEEQVGNLNCRGLLGIDILNEVARQKAEIEGRFEEICDNCIRKVVRYLDAVI